MPSAQDRDNAAATQQSNGKKKKKATQLPTNNIEQPLTPDQQLVYYQRQVVALKLALDKTQLQQSQHQLTTQQLRQQLQDANTLMLRKQQEFDNITTDLTRQYKSMRSELLKKISDLEQQLQATKDGLIVSKRHSEELQNRHAAELQRKQSEVDDLHIRMNEMTNEFSHMLKATLDKMSEKIEITQHIQTHRHPTNTTNNQPNATNSSQQQQQQSASHSNSVSSIQRHNTAAVQSTLAVTPSAQSIGVSEHPTSRRPDPIVKTFEDFSLVPPSYSTTLR